MYETKRYKGSTKTYLHVLKHPKFGENIPIIPLLLRFYFSQERYKTFTFQIRKLSLTKAFIFEN